MKIMKKRSLIYTTLCAVVLLIASCAENDYATFNDSDAFVAFDNKTASINETATEGIKIPVTLSSIGGIETIIELEIDSANSTAIAGENYTIASKNLTFTKDAPVQYITLNVTDNDEYTGDLKLTIRLKENDKVNLGASYSCTVTIVDDEHPLAFILNDYSASADSYFENRGHFDWTVSIIKDDADANKVWICNLEPYFGGYGYNYASGCNLFYGVVNEEKSIISVPVGQEIGYDAVTLAAFDDPDPDAAGETYITSGSMEIAISADGSILTITNAWGMYEDGWWNIFNGGIELTKK